MIHLIGNKSKISEVVIISEIVKTSKLVEMSEVGDISEGVGGDI